MLSVVRVTTAQAKDYYSQDDYYLETAGVWQGKGAEALELDGKIKEEDFNQLIKGKTKQFEIASGGKNNEHTAGADLTFSAPKSVSCMALLFDDARIKEAHNLAVTRTLEYVENNLSQVRLKVGGKVLFEKTDNLIAGKFMHVSSRELDPQLHTHCVVINASQKDDGKWRAFDYSEIFNNKKDLGMMYRNELAIELQKMGFEIEFVKPDLFEIAGFDKAVLEEFSIRSKQIDARFQELKALHPNTNDAVLKNQATIETRKVKDEPKLEVLKEQWAERLNNLGINQQNIIKHDDTLPEQLNLSVNDAVNKSMQILTETEAVINQEKIIAMTNKLNFAKFSTSEIIENLQSNPNLVNLGSNKYTTKEIKHTERAILNFVENTQNTQAKIISEPEKLRTGIEEYELSQGFSLTCDQRNAVKHILDTKDKVIAIQGDAGTGKTTMLDTVRTICDKECQDVEIVGLSFTGKAAHEIQEASNIQSSTIASFLNSKTEINPNQKRLYVIDEASMLSIQDMKRVLQKCESENAKIVLIGDTKQLQAIGAGKIFQSLQEHEKIATVHMKESKRQSEAIYKESADLMANKKTIEAFHKLTENNKIIEIVSKNERFDTIATEYCNSHKDTILVTARNADREALNSGIRQKLQEQNKISKVDNDLTIRESKNLQPADKYFTQNYAIGDIVVCHSDLMGKAGTEIKITGINRKTNEIIGVNKSNVEFKVNVMKHGNELNIFKEATKQFAVGEKIVFLKNDKGLQVMNGQTATIDKIEGSIINLKLDDGTEKKINLETQYKYLTHGYAVTDYKAQGQTANNVIYHADTDSKVTFNQAYVGITRGKKNISIYTNSNEKLAKSIGVEQEKTSTLTKNIKFTPQKQKFKIKHKKVTTLKLKM